MAEKKVLPEGELVPYKRKMSQIVSMFSRPPSEATRLLDHLYIGSEMDATNLRRLQSMGITHIINTVESYCKTGASYYGRKVKYMGFASEDDDEYDILQHHDAVYDFIEDARRSGGKALVHCVMGINRSGALAVSYIMVHRNLGPLTTVRLVKRARNAILTNNYFQYQVIQFANQKGLLVLDKDQV